MNQKGIFSIVIILIIVGVLAIGGGIWYWQKQIIKENIIIKPFISYVDKQKSEELDKHIISEIKELGFSEMDIASAYKSDWGDEYLIFLKKGIVSNRPRPSILYIPFDNITGVTKELCGLKRFSDEKKYLMTVKTDILKSGTILIVKTEYMTIDKYKKGVEFDGGVIVFERVNIDKISMIDKSFESVGLIVSEVECSPK